MKKQMSRKIISLVMMVIGIVSIAAQTGCYTDNISDEKQVLVYSENTSITFSWWGNDPRHIYTMEGIELFESEHPGIVVEEQYGEWSGFEKRNKVWMKSQTEADVMQINFAWINQYSPDGEGYYDLYELSDVIDLSNYTKEDLSYGEVNGHLNAIPIAYNTQMYAVNKDVFDKYGLSVPKTFDDLFAAAEVMSVDGVYPIGMVKKQMFLLLCSYYEQKYGHNIFASDGTVLATQKEAEELMLFYCELIDKKVLMPIDQFSQDAFTKGTVASSMFWISDTGNYCTKAEDAGRVVEISDYLALDDSKASVRYIKPATMYAISRKTKNPEEAGELLDFLINSEKMAELQGTEKGVPISKSAYTYLESEDMLSSWQTIATEDMKNHMDSMVTMIPAMEDEDTIDTFKSVADDYMYGQMSIEEAVNQVYQVIKAGN